MCGRKKFAAVKFLPVLVVLIFMISAGTAAAAGKVSIAQKVVWKDYAGVLEISNLPAKAKLVSAKSSNKAVLSASVTDQKDMAVIVALKPGKSKVTVTYKVGSKKQTVSRTITVRNYPNPVKGIKLNGKAKKFDRQMSLELLYVKTGKIKTNFQLEPGWSITKASTVQILRDGKFITKAFKNGMSIDKKKYDFISITLQLKKKSDVVSYELVLS